MFVSTSKDNDFRKDPNDTFVVKNLGIMYNRLRVYNSRAKSLTALLSERNFLPLFVANKHV